MAAVKKALEGNNVDEIKDATDKLTKVFYEISEKLYSAVNQDANGAAGFDPSQAAGTANQSNESEDGNVVDADYKVEDDNENK